MEALVTLAMFAAFGLFMLLLLALFLTGAYLAFGRYTGRRSPWGRLAGHYPALSRPRGQEFAWQTVRIGPRLYTGAVGIVLSANGMYMNIWTPGNPPILLPWSEIAATTAGRLAIGRGTVLHLGRPEAGTVTVGAGMYVAMWPYLVAATRHRRVAG